MNPQDQQPGNYNYYRMPDKKPKKLTFAIMSFVFSLLPILLCCCAVYPATIIFLLLLSVLALVLGIISIATHKDGKGFAITGIIISVIMSISLLFTLIFLSGPLSDMAKFSETPQKYIDEYEETGEVPEEFEKYKDSKYDWVWKSMGMSSFDQFYGDFIARYKEQSNFMLPFQDSGSSSKSDSGSSSGNTQEPTTRPSNYGEDPITI